MWVFLINLTITARLHKPASKELIFLFLLSERGRGGGEGGGERERKLIDQCVITELSCGLLKFVFHPLQCDRWLSTFIQ